MFKLYCYVQTLLLCSNSIIMFKLYYYVQTIVLCSNYACGQIYFIVARHFSFSALPLNSRPYLWIWILQRPGGRATVGYLYLLLGLLRKGGSRGQRGRSPP